MVDDVMCLQFATINLLVLLDLPDRYPLCHLLQPQSRPCSSPRGLVNISALLVLVGDSSCFAGKEFVQYLL